jgi:hypothetical protein
MTFPVPVQPYPIDEQEFQELLKRVERLLDRVGQGVDRLFDNCNRVVHLLPGFLADRLAAALRELGGLIGRFFAEIAKIMANPGWPPGVLTTASDWTNAVGGPVSGLAGNFTLDEMGSDNKWQGPAAEAYRDVLPTQKTAVEGIKQLTDALDSNLTKVGWGIIALWAGLAIAIGSFVVELIAEAAAAATAVGAPPAAAAAGVSTAKVIGLVAAVVSAFLAYVGLLVDGLSTLRQKLAGHEPYPQGSWPRSTTGNFSDGSLSDGDGTDWRMKY